MNHIMANMPSNHMDSIDGASKAVIEQCQLMQSASEMILQLSNGHISFYEGNTSASISVGQSNSVTHQRLSAICACHPVQINVTKMAHSANNRDRPASQAGKIEMFEINSGKAEISDFHINFDPVEVITVAPSVLALHSAVTKQTNAPLLIGQYKRPRVIRESLVEQKENASKKDTGSLLDLILLP